MLTNWVESGLDHPLPRELWFDVRLEASSVDEAISRARVLVSGFAAVVAFSTNAEIGTIEPHIAFDSTHGVSERAFVEYFVPDERGLIPPSREGDPDVITSAAQAVFDSSHWKRISTALAHYHAALGNYHVGGESLAVGHLFMAAEALREATLAEYCKKSGRSEAQIMSDEGHDHRGHLLAWARRELIFAGDRVVYTGAKRLMSSIIGSSGSNPRGGRFSVSSRADHDGLHVKHQLTPRRGHWGCRASREYRAARAGYPSGG